MMKRSSSLRMIGRRVWSCEHGSNLVEFGFSAVFLLLLIAGIVDFGGALQNFIIMENAAHEGARTAALLPCNAANRAAYRAAVVGAAVGEATASNLTLNSSNISYTPNLASSCPTAGGTVRVTVSHSYNSFFAGILGFGTLDMVARVDMLFFGNDVSGWPAIAAAGVLYNGTLQEMRQPW
jgi:Flp pilus assembly protein TadG